MNNHTPGPWQTSEIDSLEKRAWAWRISAQGHWIADLGACSPRPDLRARGWEDPGISLANARLIAAAPELLAACAAAYSLIGLQSAGPGLEVSKQLAAAIAKAKGTP